jgi:hypothetical protein
MGQPLTSYIPTTALATLALQQDAGAREAAEKGITYIKREIAGNPSTMNLALALLCLDAFDEPHDELRDGLLKRQENDGSWRGNVHLTALALIALQASGDFDGPGRSNVFRLS